MATKRFGQGTLVQYGDGGSPTESYTTVWGAKGIKLGGVQTGFEETTNHSSSPLGYIERDPTLIDPGKLTFDCFYDYADSSHQGVKTLAANKTERNWQVLAPDGTTVIYRAKGVVENRSRDFPENKHMTMSVGVQLTEGPSIDL